MRIRAAAILVEDHQVALIERHRPGRHYFSFPGGSVDKGETPEQAVVREMEEETGLQIAVKQKLAQIVFQGKSEEFFLVERLGGEYGTGTGEEYQERTPHLLNLFGTYHPVWMPVSDLLQNPVLPVEIAEIVTRHVEAGWPMETIEIGETA
jgi:mutator protein MutT